MTVANSGAWVSYMLALFVLALSLGSAPDGGSALTPDNPAWRSPAGYQETRWGMTAPEVREAVGAELEGDGRLMLAPPGTVVGLPATVRYIFTDGRLSAVGIGFDVAPSEVDKEFRRLSRMLRKKYGPSTLTDRDGGQTELWLRGPTRVALSDKRMGRFRLTVTYLSAELNDLANQASKAKEEAMADEL